MPMPVNTIKVKFINNRQPVIYQSTASGISDNPPRLWIEDGETRYYIMLDAIEWYSVGDYDPYI